MTPRIPFFKDQRHLVVARLEVESELAPRQNIRSLSRLVKKLSPKLPLGQGRPTVSR